MQELISIIIPCYNQGRYLGAALDSVLQQTYTHWECIIVDNGSTDNTAEVAKKYAHNDPRFTYEHLPNLGVSVARNHGFKLAKGNFIQFLDGDDFIASLKLEKQVACLISNPDFNVCYSDVYHYFQKYDNYKLFKHKKLTEYPLNQFLFEWDRGGGITIHSALFRKSIWDNGSLPFDPQYKDRYEDWIFWIKLGLVGIRFKYFPLKGAFYRIHDTNFVRSYKDALMNFLRAVIYIKPLLPKEIQDEFFTSNVSFILERYANEKINQEIKGGLVWKIAKLISLPFKLVLPTRLKAKYKFTV